jgi:hypothetical protein
MQAFTVSDVSPRNSIETAHLYAVITDQSNSKYDCMQSSFVLRCRTTTYHPTTASFLMPFQLWILDPRVFIIFCLYPWVFISH